MSKKETVKAVAKNPGAVALGSLRWKGVSDEERKSIMSKASYKRWAHATKKARAAQGAMLAKARAEKITDRMKAARRKIAAEKEGEKKERAEKKERRAGAGAPAVAEEASGD